MSHEAHEPDPAAAGAQSPRPGLPADLAAYRDAYQDMFGVVPPLPEAKFAFTSTVDPDFLRAVEALRAHAFHNTVLDPKVTQLVIVAMMLATGGGAAEWHVRAARRAGASWLELQTVAELASAVAALGPANVGGALLGRLRAEEGTPMAPTS